MSDREFKTFRKVWTELIWKWSSSNYSRNKIFHRGWKILPIRILDFPTQHTLYPRTTLQKTPIWTATSRDPLTCTNHWYKSPLLTRYKSLLLKSSVRRSRNRSYWSDSSTCNSLNSQCNREILEAVRDFFNQIMNITISSASDIWCEHTNSRKL